MQPPSRQIVPAFPVLDDPSGHAQSWAAISNLTQAINEYESAWEVESELRQHFDAIGNHFARMIAGELTANAHRTAPDWERIAALSDQFARQ